MRVASPARYAIGTSSTSRPREPHHGRRLLRPPSRRPRLWPPRSPQRRWCPRARPPCRLRRRPGRSRRRSRSRPHSRCGFTGSLAPGSVSRSRMEPPPTTTTGIGSALVFIRSTVSAIRSSILASAGPRRARPRPESTDLREPGGHGEVGRGQDVTAEDQARVTSSVADALGSDLGAVDVRAAADSERARPAFGSSCARRRSRRRPRAESRAGGCTDV